MLLASILSPLLALRFGQALALARFLLAGLLFLVFALFLAAAFALLFALALAFAPAFRLGAATCGLWRDFGSALGLLLGFAFALGRLPLPRVANLNPAATKTINSDWLQERRI